MKSILLVLAAALIALTNVPPALAADPSNPTPPLPQPVVHDGRTASATPMVFQRSEARIYTQFELHMIQAYRMNVNADPNRVDFLQSPGDAGSGAGAGDGSGS